MRAGDILIMGGGRFVYYAKKIVGNYKERLKWGFSNVQLIKILALEKCITAFPILHQKEYYNTIKCTVFWWGDHDYSNSLNLITIYWRQCVFPGWSLKRKLCLWIKGYSCIHCAHFLHVSWSMRQLENRLVGSNFKVHQCFSQK